MPTEPHRLDSLFDVQVLPSPPAYPVLPRLPNSPGIFDARPVEACPDTHRISPQEVTNEVIDGDV